MSNKKSIFICNWCKKEFEEWTYRHPKFCSSQCRSEFGARQPKKRPFGVDMGGKIKWNCKQCEKEMYTFKSRVRDTCSKRCARIYFTPRDTYQCKECGKEKKVTNKFLKLFKPKYCSKECANKAHSKRMMKPDRLIPIYDRGQNWQSQSRAARKRDKYICQNCYKRGIDVHHIKPFRQFNGDWKSANILSNLITLCKSCHMKIEHNIIPCPKPK